MMWPQAKTQLPGTLFIERHICQCDKCRAANTQNGARRADLHGIGLTFGDAARNKGREAFI